MRTIISMPPVRKRTLQPGAQAHPTTLILRGSEFFKLGDYDAAIEDLKLSTQLNPDWPFAYNNLGAAYGMKGEWVLSVAAFSAAIDVAQRKQMGFNPKPYHGRAQTYERMGRPDLARRDYEVTCKKARMGCEKLVK